MNANHEDIWTIWDYPDDPDWDGESYDIGYMTDSGSGSLIASGLTLEDARLIIRAVKVYIAFRQALRAAA